jgi:hypothetical protein
MKFFDVIIRTSSQRLPVILQVLDGAMELVSVKQAEAVIARNDSDAPKFGPRYKNGKRDKGISGAELAMKLLKDATGPMRVAKLAEGFVAQGFAAKTISPVLTELKRAGMVEPLGGSMYRLTKKATSTPKPTPTPAAT